MHGWGTEVGFYHTLEQKSSHCVFIVKDLSVRTLEAETVIDNSFTSIVDLNISVPHAVAPYTP